MLNNNNANYNNYKYCLLDEVLSFSAFIVTEVMSSKIWPILTEIESIIRSIIFHSMRRKPHITGK